jgi:serine protease Do
VEDIRRDATVQAIEKVIPSVVNIATAKEVIPYTDFQDIFGRYFRQYAPEPQEVPNSIGSGVIISEDGYVLTSLHVVNGVSRIQVQLWDGRVYDCDGIVGTANSDVALLKIKGKPGEKFKVIPFARDDDLLLGETVMALGDPFALGGTVTKGILSSKTRRRPMDGPLEAKDWLQTDAAINEGNSGGPLINLRGEMIGLNVAYATNSPASMGGAAIAGRGEGIGFAIPIRQVQNAISQFFCPEVTDSLWFGARVKAGNGPLRVNFLQHNSPASRAGLHLGDEILALNGKPENGVIQFNRDLCGTSTNRNLRATLLVSHNGQRGELNVEMIPFETLFREKLGVKVRPMTPQEAAAMPIFMSRNNEFLVIEQVYDDSPAAAAKLQKGFIVVGIDGQKTPTLLALADVLSTKRSGDHTKIAAIIQQMDGATVSYQSGEVDLIVR